jgi:uncharacterized membrane protein YdjX (TVP38/TMEM64 family)
MGGKLKKTIRYFLMKRKFWVIVAVVLLFILIRHLYLYHTGDMKELMLWLKENLGWKAALVAGIVYILLLSIPFFPGVELAWLVIMLFGKEAVVMIYFFTICGLSLSFAMGRWFEKSWFTSGLDIQALEEQFSERMGKIKDKLRKQLPDRFVSQALKQRLPNSRYMILAILINLPGNTIIGGGGGLALLCGMNQAFSWKGFVVTVALAILPLPILLFMGLIQIDAFIG